jgi:membrane protein implicated in regulation of membrane protease activity
MRVRLIGTVSLYPLAAYISLLGRGGMNKRIVAIMAIVVVATVVVAAFAYYSLTQKSKESPTSTEYVGGKYNSTLSFFKDGHVEIEYKDENGSHSEHYFEP